jgi:hypothetical protein
MQSDGIRRDRRSRRPFLRLCQICLCAKGDRLPRLYADSPGANPARTYEKPRVLRVDGRILLHISGVESGTGLANSERLFVWRGDGWRDVDVTSWLEELERRAPPGFSAVKAIFPDYVTLKASTPLWLDSDDVDCPSGKRADLTLAWRSDRIALDSVRLQAAGECGKPLR